MLIWEDELLIFSLAGLVSLRRWPHVRLDLSVEIYKEREKSKGKNFDNLRIIFNH